MLNKYTYEDKTIEKALEKCLNDLNVTKDDIYYKEEIQKGSLLKASKAIIEVIKKYNIKILINNFIKEIGKYINLTIKTDIYFTDENIKVILDSENNAVLIGKNGKMLNSIQTLLKKYIENETSMNLKVYIDIENYKQKKIENLEKNVRKIINEVLLTKIDAKLDEMNSYERRIVHNIVSEYDFIISESFGETPHRYVVIKYVEGKE